MKISDVRKMAIRQQTRVRFRMSNGQDCVIDEHGIARVPGIRDALHVSLDEELALAQEAHLESSAIPAKVAPRTVTRAELERLTSSQPLAEHDDHDE